MPENVQRDRDADLLFDIGTMDGVQDCIRECILLVKNPVSVDSHADHGVAVLYVAGDVALGRLR